MLSHARNLHRPNIASANKNAVPAMHQWSATWNTESILPSARPSAYTLREHSFLPFRNIDGYTVYKHHADSTTYSNIPGLPTNDYLYTRASNLTAYSDHDDNLPSRAEVFRYPQSIQPAKK